MNPFKVPDGITLNALVAADLEDGIGYKNKLPWHIPADLKRFKDLTLNHIVIMGRNTFESLPCVLPNRTIWVLTQNPDFKAEGVRILNSLTELEIALSELPVPLTVWVAGGAKIYKTLIPYYSAIHLTRVNATYVADTYFPPLTHEKWTLQDFKRIPAKDGAPSYSFCLYVAK